MSDLVSQLRRRPAVHQLCAGPFLQEHVWLSDDLLAVPLRALGYPAQAQYTAMYAQDIAGASVDESAVKALAQQGAEAFPVVSITRFFAVDASAHDLESAAELQFTQARRIVSWSSGDHVTPFALVTATATESFFRLLLPHSRRRHRLGLPSPLQYQAGVSAIYQTACKDEHFEFALSLLYDASQEANPIFKIARLYNCLECLAYKLKARNGGKSRKAVKELLGFGDGPTCTDSVNGETFRYDAIEVAGRIRDKLFHGVPFLEEHLNAESRSVFRLLAINPQSVVSALLSYCEIEIGQWSQGTSKGLVP